MNDPELIAEYKQHHSKGAVWSEIVHGLKKVGVLDMEIYLDGNTLFMIMDTLPDFNHDSAMTELAGLPRQAEWEVKMFKYQKSEEGASASEKWKLMDRVFELAQNETFAAVEGQVKTTLDR